MSASYDCTAMIWNTTTGDCQAVLKGHSRGVNSVVFSPDGMHVVSASNDHTARIWNTTTGDCQAVLKGHLGGVNSVVFSPDGRHIVSASYDHTARIWNITTGDCQAVPKGHSEEDNPAAFFPGSNDHNIWNALRADCQEIDHTAHINTVSSSHGVFLRHGFCGQIHPSLQSSFLDMYQNYITHINNLQQLWIPPQYRNPPRISHHLSKICFESMSKELFILEVCIIHIYIYILYYCLTCFLQYSFLNSEKSQQTCLTLGIVDCLQYVTLFTLSRYLL